MPEDSDEFGQLVGRLAEVAHRVDRAMQRIDAAERAALVARERADRVSGRVEEIDHRVDRAMERIDEIEKVALVVQERIDHTEKLAESPGDGTLSRQERIALLAGAPVVIAAVIAALVEILRILGSTA